MHYLIIIIGIVCLFVALAAHGKVDKLERKLKEKGLLEDDGENEDSQEDDA